MTAYIPTSMNCATPSTTETEVMCMLLQAKIEFPEQPVVPPMLYVSQVTLKAPLKLTSVSLDQITCVECQGGLVQIMAVYNKDPLIEMVAAEGFQCSNSVSGYYGCLYATTSIIIQDSPDNTFLNIAFASSFDL
jgi:hypothetical protein